jgi:hypothetical protein
MLEGQAHRWDEVVKQFEQVPLDGEQEDRLLVACNCLPFIG